MRSLVWSGVAAGLLAFAALMSPAQECRAATGGGLGPIDPDEMRITFMGTSFLPRLSQEANSVFVECGEDGSFVFDCGSGVVSKYIAMGVAYSQMDKIFLTHLHADHMSDLMFIYCFGPSGDRLTGLHVWGPTGPTEEDGITAFCGHLYAMTHWHRESFSFLPTGLTTGQDGYDLVPHECSYTQAMQSILSGHGAPVAYDSNNVKISYFPMIHDRDGAIAFKLEWRGLKMVFSGDSLPNTLMIDQAQGLDVLIHELTLSPEVWAEKNSGGLLTPDPDNPLWVYAVSMARRIQNCSHTPARAFGYIMSRTNPRLGIATHFQNQSDTVGAVHDDISVFYPYEDSDNPPRVLLATDCMVVNVPVDKGQPIRWYHAIPDPYAFQAKAKVYDNLADPKYPDNRSQFSSWLKDLIINPQVYDPSPSGDSGDYDGDGTSDIAIFRTTSGLWSIRGISQFYFGSGSEIPMAGDYNGDGRTEAAIYRGQSGLWTVRGLTRAYFGVPSDVPVARDYNGDGKTDIAVFRGASGFWAIRGISRVYFGAVGDIPVPGYYSGNRADLAVFRPTTRLWAVRDITRFYFGTTSSDQPMPGDYAGTGFWQAAIFPYSGGLWKIRGLTQTYFGAYDDKPLSGKFDGPGSDGIGIFRGDEGLWAVKRTTQVYYGNMDDVPATR